MLQATDVWSTDNAQPAHLINLAMGPGDGRLPQESTVNNMSMMLLRHFSLLIQGNVCRESRHAKSNICLLGCAHNVIICLVQENKQFQPDNNHPQPQLIAEAIAAFEYSNQCQQSGAWDAVFHYNTSNFLCWKNTKLLQNSHPS
jgi:hypothetical protein